MIQLRDYQERISTEGSNLLSERGIAYLAMQVRTGKTLTALSAAEKFGAACVLFITKKKAISSILEDYSALNPNYDITVINKESMHKIEPKAFDLVVVDEAHGVAGAYPKPSLAAKYIRQHYGHLPMIFLSGTPTPESYSQIFHQFWLSKRTPFPHINFYKWAKDYVKVTERNFGYATVKDYSGADRDSVMQVVAPYMLTYTQQQAGFEAVINEQILTVKMRKGTERIARELQENQFIVSKDGRDVVADTAVKMMMKLHQIWSGTVKCDDNSTIIFDLSKAEFIRDRFAGQKIGIFYKFKAEYDALRQVFGDNLTDSVEEFDSTDKNIALQIVSGREGLSLKNAQSLVFYNIDFSAVSYWQARDRMTVKDRAENNVYWVFSDGGIETKIFKAVMNKRNYTKSIFLKDHGIKVSK